MKKYDIIILFAIIGVIACTTSDEPSLPSKEKHIIFIGLDGWGGYEFENSLSHMPHVLSYSREGIYTDKKNAVSPTASGPNWASIFMGTTPDIHGYTNWDNKVPSEPYSFEVHNDIFPTISQALKLDKSNSEIGMFCQWAGILYLVDTLSINHYSHMPMAEYNHDEFTDSIISYLKSFRPVLCTIVFDDPDHTGHKDNYFSSEYYKVLEELDECITKIVMSVKDAGYYDDTVFILTSDHGGNGNSHGGESIQEKQTPFVMWGKDVKKIGFVDDNLEQQDIAIIIASVLGFQIPKLWTGKCHANYFK